jgi:ribosomal protein L29
MKYKELEGKSDKELQGMLSEDRATLHAMKLKTSVNQLKDVRDMRDIRKRMARLLTKLNSLKKA